MLILVSKTVVVTKPLESGLFLSTSPIFFSKLCLPALYWFMWIKVVASGISFSKLFTFAFSVINFVFLTTSVKFFQSTGTDFDIQTCKLTNFGFKLFKLVGTLVSLLMSNLSSSAFKAIKSF